MAEEIEAKQEHKQYLKQPPQKQSTFDQVNIKKPKRPPVRSSPAPVPKRWERPPELAQAGKHWTDEEKELLTHYFDQQMSLEEIARLMRRGGVAVQVQLFKLKLIQ